jgi:hypothetical protein
LLLLLFAGTGTGSGFGGLAAFCARPPHLLARTKVTGIPTFGKSFQSSFSLPLYTRTFSQHPLPKNALPSSISH